MFPTLIFENIFDKKIIEEIVDSISNKDFKKAPNNSSLESYQVEKTFSNFNKVIEEINNKINLFYRKKILSNSGTSIVRYTEGKFIGRHRDWEPSDPFVTQNKKSKVDLASVCYLNDDYYGGEICFYENLHSKNPYTIIKPKAGMCIFFDSSIYHETKPIISGIKYSYTAFYQLED
jgi:predicted 2-oxoglutarate/Fe(II)-dependent dioxygenase YbiX